MVANEKARGRGRRFVWAGLALLLAAAAAPHAAAQEVMARSGDWEYGADGGLAAASTQNAEGAMFGLVCSPNCIGFVKTDQACDEAIAYDGVMSSPGRADSLRLECRRIDDGYALLFTPNEAFIDTLRNGPEVTVSIPMASGPNRELRFSLNGAYDAVYVTLATAIAVGSVPSEANPPAP